MTTSIAGPVRTITRTITTDNGHVTSRVDDGVRAYSSGHHDEREAGLVIEKQTDTLILCQLWDTVPGLQWRKSEWGKSLREFKLQSA